RGRGTLDNTTTPETLGLCTSKSSTAFCGEISEQKIGEVGQSPGGVKEKLCANKYILAKINHTRGRLNVALCFSLPKKTKPGYSSRAAGFLTYDSLIDVVAINHKTLCCKHTKIININNQYAQ
ncbi:MAG: hypothetical protein IKZ14_06715, partial [Muribaculaceae bacterium]|nr:hypothetical protein [Muribaculaceae bacterium]